MKPPVKAKRRSSEVAPSSPGASESASAPAARPAGRNLRLIGVPLLVLLLVGAVYWWNYSQLPARQPLAPLTPPSGITTSPSLGAPTAVTTRPASPTKEQWLAKIDQFIPVFKATPQVPATQEELKALVGELVASGSPSALQAVIEFLKSGRDAAIADQFQVIDGGILEAWPSLRVAMLDVLGQISPVEAAAYGEKVLSRHDSADEWAIALRNYAWLNREDQRNPYLVAKTHEMLTVADWLQHPTSGFLQAFDLAVFTRSFDLIPQFSQYLQPNAKVDKSVQWASFLATDRLLIADRTVVLEQILADPTLYAQTPHMRASFFSRADVRVPAQRTALEKYLMRQDLTEVELARFADQYPNYTFVGSPGLFTPPIRLNQSDLAAQDKAALGVVRQWNMDSRFAARASTLRKIQDRLQRYVASAEKGAQERKPSTTPVKQSGK